MCDFPSSLHGQHCGLAHKKVVLCVLACGVSIGSRCLCVCVCVCVWDHTPLPPLLRCRCGRQGSGVSPRAGCLTMRLVPSRQSTCLRPFSASLERDWREQWVTWVDWTWTRRPTSDWTRGGIVTVRGGGGEACVSRHRRRSDSYMYQRIPTNLFRNFVWAQFVVFYCSTSNHVLYHDSRIITVFMYKRKKNLGLWKKRIISDRNYTDSIVCCHWRIYVSLKYHVCVWL